MSIAMSGPSIVQADWCRLSATVPMASLGTNGIQQAVVLRGIVPVSTMVSVLLAGAHRQQYRGTGTTL